MQTVSATPNPVPGNFADLIVTDIVSPSSAYQGQPITISWRVSNGGTGPTSSRNGASVSSWSDRIVLSPDEVFGDADDILLANVPHAGALNVGGSYAGTATVQIPSDLLGNYFLFVMVDAADQVYEHLDSGGNLGIPRPISITFLPPSPDLKVEDVRAPPSASPGQMIEATWKVVNQGSAPAVGSLSDAISISSDEVIGNDFAIATVAFDYSIPPGNSVTRSAQVTVPFAAPAGVVRFVVRADSANALTEMDENNNAAIASEITDIAKVLTITLPVTQIAENAANPVIQGLVTRSGLTAAALVVTVSSSDSTEATVPATVTIPAGQASTVVPVTVQRDGIVDGSQQATIAVSADGFSPGSVVLTVLDTDVQHLGLVIDPTTLSEGESANGTVFRDTINNQPLVVTLTSSSPSQLGVPSTVTIPANEAAALFSVIAIEDALIESTRTFSVGAAAAGFIGVSQSVTIRESDIPQVSISLDKTTVSEGAGPQAAVATITRSPVTDQPVTVALENSDTSAALVPATVIIPANEAFVFVPIGAVNDDLVDGPQVTTITPFAINPQTSAHLSAGTPVSLTVTDDDGPTLKLVIALASSFMTTAETAAGTPGARSAGGTGRRAMWQCRLPWHPPPQTAVRLWPSGRGSRPRRKDRCAHLRSGSCGPFARAPCTEECPQ